MSELTEFLSARIAEEEAVAREAGALAWHTLAHEMYEGRIEDSAGEVVVYDEGSPNAAEADHIARHDPARVLAECEAKRAIVEQCASGLADGAFGESTLAEAVLHLLASPYADHPDYRPDWRS